MSIEQFNAFRDKVADDRKLQAAIFLRRGTVEVDGAQQQMDFLGALDDNGEIQSLMDIGAAHGYDFSLADVETALGMGQAHNDDGDDELTDFELELVQAAGFGNCVLPDCPTGCPPDNGK